jgi:hypothetical protein
VSQPFNFCFGVKVRTTLSILSQRARAVLTEKKRLHMSLPPAEKETLSVELRLLELLSAGKKSSGVFFFFLLSIA